MAGPDLEVTVTVRGADAEAVLLRLKGATAAVKEEVAKIDPVAKNAAAEMKMLGDAAMRAADKSKDLFAKGVSGGGGELAGHLKDIREGFRLAGDETNSTATRLRAFAGSVGIAASIVAEFAGALNTAALAAQAEREQIHLLGAAHEQMRAGTNSTISLAAESALQEGMLAHNISLTAQEYVTAARAAREWAAIHNQDISAGVSHVVGTLTAEAGALDSTAAASTRAHAALARLADQQAQHAPLARSAAENQALADEGLQRMGRSILELVLPGTEHLTNVVRDYAAQQAVAARATATATSAEQAHRNAQLTALQAEEAATRGVIALKNAHDQLAGAINGVKNANNMLSADFRSDELPVDRIARRLEGAAMAAQGIAAQRTENRALRSGLHSMRTHGSITRQQEQDRLGALGISTGGGTDPAVALRAQLAALQAGQENKIHLDRITRIDIHGRAVVEREAHWLQRTIDRQTAANADHLTAVSSRFAREDELRRAEHEAERAKAVEQVNFLKGLANREIDNDRTKNAALAELSQQRNDQRDKEAKKAGSWTGQMNDAFDKWSNKTGTAASETAGLVGGALNTMTSAFKSHLAAVIEGRENIGEALRAIAHETLLSLAVEAAQMAIMETAKGVAKAAFSYGSDVTAAAHFAAAGLFTTVAIAGGLGAYATNAPAATGAGAGSGGFANRSAGTGPAANDNSRGTYNYNVYVTGGIVDHAGLMDAQRAGWQQMAREGSLPTEARR